MYTKEEIEEVRNTFTGKRKLSSQEIEVLRSGLGNKQLPHHLYPFSGLFATNLKLYKKVARDERTQKYSFFGFFPETLDLVYGSEVSPEISFDNGNRGIVGIIKHPKKNIVIKPFQNSREHEIAQIADELEIGPKQYPSLEGFLTEQFVEGDLFSKLRGDKASADNMYDHGRRMGEILTKLHSKEICYNDTILTDDLGRSQVIVPETSPAILFDYGVSLRMDKHPNLTDEEVFNFVRTLPGVNMLLETRPSHEQLNLLVKNYRTKLQRATKKQIMARDIDFIHEGLTFANHRLGHQVINPFLHGFKEIYKE